MRQFAKVAIVCNVMFLLCVAVDLGYIGISDQNIINYVVIPGYLAVVLNAFFIIITLMISLFKRKMIVHYLLFIINLIFFVAQIYWFFFMEYSRDIHS